jgi:hypothetical protein
VGNGRRDTLHEKNRQMNSNVAINNVLLLIQSIYSKIASQSYIRQPIMDAVTFKKQFRFQYAVFIKRPLSQLPCTGVKYYLITNRRKNEVHSKQTRCTHADEWAFPNQTVSTRRLPQVYVLILSKNEQIKYSRFHIQSSHVTF